MVATLDFAYLCPIADDLALTVNSKTTTDTTPPITGTAAEDGVNIAIEVWTTDPVPVQVFGPVNVQAVNGIWTLPDNTITPSLNPGTYQVRAAGVINGDAETATGALIITGFRSILLANDRGILLANGNSILLAR